MLADIGMVKMYSKSAHVNDLGGLHGQVLLLVALINWPPSLHGPALLLVPTFLPPGGFCHTLQVHTAPFLHLPLFLEETFLHTLVSLLFMECKLHMGRLTFKASKQQWQQRDIL